MAMKPTSEPTDRSMLRDTMMSTMPVARMATLVAWTASVTMLIGRRNLPSSMTLKTTRMMARATTIPNRRRSISVAAPSPRRPGRAVPELPGAGAASATLATNPS